jgi:hypothetical protein
MSAEAPFDEIRVIREANRIINKAMQRIRKAKLPTPKMRNRELWPLVPLLHLWWS